ncbi:hypothetical protein IKE82_00655 [Candidatus Saccharibacteria bacterium]|nr:hypothetical protein [Candidatus Saccharibacteria bacterium]
MLKKYVAAICSVLVLLCLVAVPVGAISEAQQTVISDHCGAIKEDLKNVQRADARARVYIGGRYETILSDFVKPLNLGLVEKNLSRTELIESQNAILGEKLEFANDYIDYQQGLEQLVAMDCKAEPEKFYDKLVRVRQKRKKVEQDMQKMAKILEEYKAQVVKLKEVVSGKTK